MYRTCKISSKKNRCQCLSGDFLTQVKPFHLCIKSERSCSIVKLLSATQMRQCEDGRHNAKCNQVCFQWILSEIKSILHSGKFRGHFWLFWHVLSIPLLWTALLSLQAMSYSVLHQSCPVFGENIIYCCLSFKLLHSCS